MKKWQKVFQNMIKIFASIKYLLYLCPMKNETFIYGVGFGIVIGFIMALILILTVVHFCVIRV